MLSANFTIYYSDESIDDLSAIAAHYQEIKPSLKAELQQAILNAEADILRNPFAFSKINYGDFRRILLGKFPYKMIYRIKGKKIQVFAVFHKARSKQYIRNRLKK